MATFEVLNGPAVGPEGDRVEGGETPPDTWPAWFLDDLRKIGQLVKGHRSPVTAAPVGRKLATGTSHRARKSS